MIVGVFISPPASETPEYSVQGRHNCYFLKSEEGLTGIQNQSQLECSFFSDFLVSLTKISS